MKRALCLLLMICLLLPGAALGEDWDDDFSFDDFLDFEDVIVSYDNVTWNFPVDLYALDPAMVVLANNQMLLPKSFVPSPLVALKTRKENKDGTTNGGVRKATNGDLQLQETCAEALVAMFEAANEQGIKLYLKSAYRSWKTQDTMYYNRLKKYGYDDGWVIKPGASDHQTGLGCDIVSYSWRDRGMNEKFAATPEAQWMAAHCAEFGFIIRYPEDKVAITEINYEPWHLRYVGIPAATYIMENGLCLEEFHEQLMAAVDQFLADGGRPALVEGFIQVSAPDEHTH